MEPAERAYCTLSVHERGSLKMIPLQFKLDTGAGFTTISKTALYDLGYDRRWIEDNKKAVRSKVITLASGVKVNKYFVQLPLIEFCGYRAINWPFAILPDDKMDYYRLFGLNLLLYFNLRIDNDNGRYEPAHTVNDPRGEILFDDQVIYKAETVYSP